MRRILIGDVIWWSLLTLIAGGLALGAALTPQEWDFIKVAMVIVAPAGIAGIGIAAIIGRLFERPDLVVNCSLEGSMIDYTLYVWNKTSWITDYHQLGYDLTTSTKAFLNCFSGPETMAKYLDGLKIEIRDKPIKEWGIISYKNPKAGLQKGDNILFVQERGKKLSETAFGHELLHLVDEFHRGNIDYKHEDKKWWDLDLDIRVAMEKEGL